MEILKNFGVDPILLVAQIINFLIIFYLLKKFLYKPVLGMLKKREDKIAEGLKQAEEARIALEKTLEEEKKVLGKAQDEAKKIIEQSRTQATEVARKIEEETSRQAERILSEAKEKIDQQTKETEKRLSEHVSLLAEQMLTKSLQGMLDEKEQKEIATKALKRVKK